MSLTSNTDTFVVCLPIHLIAFRLPHSICILSVDGHWWSARRMHIAMSTIEPARDDKKIICETLISSLFDFCFFKHDMAACNVV